MKAAPMTRIPPFPPRVVLCTEDPIDQDLREMRDAVEVNKTTLSTLCRMLRIQVALQACCMILLLIKLFF